LSGWEQSSIAEARDRLVVVKQGEDVAVIRDAIHALDQATQRFAELMIESAVHAAIHGRN
jgi:histone H3/H4